MRPRRSTLRHPPQQRKPRHLLLALLFALPLVVSGLGAPGQAAIRQQAGAHGPVPQPPDIAAPKISSDPGQLAKEARKNAVSREQKSFVDPVAIRRARVTPPREPIGLDVDDCLSSDDAHDSSGRVYNRFLWCQRYSAKVRICPGTPFPDCESPTGKMDFDYSMVAYGRDDGQRNTKIFFKIDKLYPDVRRGRIREDSMFYQRVGCGGEPGCFSNQEYHGMPFEAWQGQWNSWMVHSEEDSSLAPFKVLRHKWFMQGYAVGWDGMPTNVNFSGEPHIIRCDSAPFYRRTRACIYDEVIPHMQYSAAPNSPVKEVADHIRCAQEAPNCHTWPWHPVAVKRIPGKFIDGNPDAPGLHRIRIDTPLYAANRREVPKACNRTGVYGAEYGLPASHNQPGQDCDEYPFAATHEGAATDGEDIPANGNGRGWKFSVLGVDPGQNRCAGAALPHYYRDDRILWDTQSIHMDTFYVKITDVPQNDPHYCDTSEEPEIDPGGDPAPNHRPVANAGPDITGDEGRISTLAGDASDADGPVTARWTYTAGPDTDSGATCWFADPHSERGGFTCNDDGTYTVTLTAADSATVTLRNVSPGLTSPDTTPTTKPKAKATTDPGLAGPKPWSLYRVGNEVKVVAPITDPGTNDTFTCNVDWDDGVKETYAPGRPTFEKGCDRAHTFKNAGMYTIKASVTDDDTGTKTETVLVVAYDPNAGQASGNGWLGPQPGQAGFAFLGGYPGGGNTPRGSSTMTFDIPTARQHLRAHHEIEWVVITRDGKIAMKGKGELLPSGKKVGFVSYAYLGCVGGTRPGCQPGGNRYRINIWPHTAGNIPGTDTIYDNRPGDFDLDQANPQNLAGGTIAILR